MLLAVAAIGLTIAEHPMSRLEYPTTRKGDTVETLHGVTVADPYRWLEDPNSEETKAWVEAQNKLSFGYLKAIEGRDRIEERLRKLWNFERFGQPQKMGQRYFYTRNDGLQNQSVLYVTDHMDQEGRVLLDPNTLSKDGTVALSGMSVSWDGRLLAYSLSAGGSDWQEWRVRDVETGKDLPDVVKWSKFSGAAWARDNSGFYYSAYDPPKEGEKLSGVNYFQKLYFHKIGASQTEDRLVYERPDQKEWGFGATTTEDGRYLVITCWRGTDRETQVLYKDLSKQDAKVEELLMGFDASYSFLENDGPVFYFQTDKNAPNRRVIAVDIRRPQHANWREIVAETTQSIESSSILGDFVFVNRLKDAVTQITRYPLNGGEPKTIDLPGLGSASGFGGLRSNPTTFYVFTGFTSPAVIYSHEVQTGSSRIWKEPRFGTDLSRYETRQVFYTSKDGTRVPMFLVHRKGLEKNGQNPTLLYGYGGFNASMTPWFSVRAIKWLEMGGVFAVACIRGGGEYGNAWHDAGRLKNKQNGFDDFIAAAEYLIAEKITSPARLAINGGSNGGLLVGAVLNQRPDLVGAALPDVGVMDMLRFHKFTIGWAWVSDYGSPDKKEDFHVLKAYSPLHNIQPGKRYPAVLVTTGDHDDRVVPAHSYKYIAALQAAQAGDAPILIRIETSAGHGAGKPISKIIEEIADQFAFLTKHLGLTVP